MAPVLGELPVLGGSVAWGVAMLPILAFLLLATVHALLPVLSQSRTGRLFILYARHGF